MNLSPRIGSNHTISAPLPAVDTAGHPPAARIPRGEERRPAGGRPEKKTETGRIAMNDKTLSVQADLKKGETERSLERIVGAMEGVVLEKPDRTVPSDLYVFELGPDPHGDLSSIQTLIKQNALSEVFLVSEQLDPEVLLKAMRMGIKEVLATPFQEDEVSAALLRCKQRRDELAYKGPVKAGKIVYVIGSKGGVGTTTVAVNLAVGLATSEARESTALVDMNMLFGEIPLFLGLRPRHHWGEIARNVHRLDRDYLSGSLFEHATGVRVLAAPREFNPGEIPVDDVITVCAMMRRMFDYVVVDGGQQLGPLSARLLEMADQILVVSALSLPCLANTNRILESFYDMGCLHKERVRVVMNRCLKKSEITARDAEESLKMKIYWSVPNDYATAVAAINRGEALVQAAPGTPLARSLRALGDKLAGREEGAGRQARGLFSRWGARKSGPVSLQEQE